MSFNINTIHLYASHVHLFSDNKILYSANISERKSEVANIKNASSYAARILTLSRDCNSRGHFHIPSLDSQIRATTYVVIINRRLFVANINLVNPVNVRPLLCR